VRALQPAALPPAQNLPAMPVAVRPNSFLIASRVKF